MSATVGPLAASTAPATHDARTYWRVVLACCAPLPWLWVALTDALAPYPLGGSSADTVRGVAAAQEQTAWVAQAQPLFFLTFVPSVLACVVLLRRTWPRTAAALGTVGVLGALAGTANPPVDSVVLAGLRAGVPADVLATQVDELASSWAGWTLLLTLLLISVGRLALGVVLYRARLAPRVLAVALVAAPFVEWGLLAAGRATQVRRWRGR